MSLKTVEITRLFQRLQPLLRQAVADRGTTFSTYVDADGKQGGHQAVLSVYGRAGEACTACGAAVIKTRVAGRGTYFCSRCQK